MRRPPSRLGRVQASLTLLSLLRRFYDSQGRLTDTIDMVPGGVVLNIEAGQWHGLRCLESGTILLEAKDGAYRALGVDEVMEK